MSQIIQHRRGSLANIKTLNTNGPIHRGEILVATGSLYISSGSTDSDNYHLSSSIFFGGSLVPDGTSNYEPITKVLSGSGLPSMTTGDYGNALNGILWINADDNKLYRLVATADANPSTDGNFTGSHQLISGGTSGGTTIGPAEDGSYADGLFTDFTENTLIGTPVDRFNEVLKALAPSPAPDLDDIDGNESAGVAGDLSFGASNSISGVTNVTTVGALSAVDVNAAFAESGDRFGIFKFSNSQSFEGDLNEDVSQGPGSPNPAYPANAFTDGNIGVLEMEVNGTTVVTASLSASNAGFTGTGANGSTLTVSATASALFPDGTALDVFVNRTGNYSVALADQRPGHNYVRIKQVKPGSTLTTNYVDWVIDDFKGSSVLDINQTGSWSFISPGTLHTVSGIKYYANGFEDNTVIPYTASYTNLYRDTYPSSGGISFASATQIGSKTISITGTGITSGTQTDASGTATFSYAALNTSVTNCHETETTMSIAITPAIDNNKFHHPAGWATTYGNDDEPINFALNVSPLHRSTLNSGTINENDYLYNSLTVNANEYQFEDFRDEEYRQAYNASSIGSTADSWNTASDLSSTTDATLYNTYLVYPTKVGNTGNLDTRYGPGSQVDYSSATGTRDYVRYFKARSADAGNKEWAIEFRGTGRIVSGSSTQFATNDQYFRVEVMRDSVGSSEINNGWVDPINPQFRVGTGFGTPNSQYIPVDSSVSYSTTSIGGITVPQGVVKFQDADGTAVAEDEVLGVRIILPQGFTGNIDAIAVRYGASSASTTALLGSTYTTY